MRLANAMLLVAAIVPTACVSSPRMEARGMDVARARAAAAGESIPELDVAAVVDTIPASDRDNYALGYRRGASAARQIDVSGRFDGGLLAGITLGLIGTGIVYVVADNADASPIASMGRTTPTIWTPTMEQDFGRHFLKA